MANPDQTTITHPDSTTVAASAATPGYTAYLAGAALFEHDAQALLKLTGGTRLTFLNNQTTADFNRAQPGDVIPAVVITSIARVIDWVRALVTDDAVWLIASPERRATLLNWFPQFIFFMDDVQVSDETANYRVFSLLGPRSEAILAASGFEGISTLPAGRHATASIAGIDGIRVVHGTDLDGPGYTLIVPVATSANLSAALLAAGAVPMTAGTWESLRVEQGRPLADRELTEEHNPLEAGLWHSVSFRKGCYIGQEIIARLDTRQNLKQQLWGIRLDQPARPGEAVLVDDTEVGTVTSAALTPGGHAALAYIRTKAGGAGLSVRVGDATGHVVDLPWLARGRSDL